LSRQMAETGQCRDVLRMRFDDRSEHAFGFIETRRLAQGRGQLATQFGVYRSAFGRRLEICDRRVELAALARDVAEPGQRIDVLLIDLEHRFVHRFGLAEAKDLAHYPGKIAAYRSIARIGFEGRFEIGERASPISSLMRETTETTQSADMLGVG